MNCRYYVRCIYITIIIRTKGLSAENYWGNTDRGVTVDDEEKEREECNSSHPASHFSSSSGLIGLFISRYYTLYENRLLRMDAFFFFRRFEGCCYGFYLFIILTVICGVFVCVGGGWTLSLATI